jgi:hypothetical protein
MDEPEWDLYLQQFENLDHTHFTKISKYTTKYCVMIEPRTHPKLIPVIKNFMYLLQKHGWGLIIFHGIENESYLHNELKTWKNVGYVQMNVANLNTEEYNNVLMSTSFWETLEQVGCKHALIFQTDTLLLKSNIDDFLIYDYVGAPWFMKFFGVLEVGNGGLSLRKVETMKMVTQKYPKMPINEDAWFAYMLLEEKKVNPQINIPTLESAKQFAVETIFYEDPCGLHKPHMDKLKCSREEFVQLLRARHVPI